jgi:FAD/FMN-containing dehydrogenase/Fe-S oxidoreductase
MSRPASSTTLPDALRARIAGEVRFDDGSRALYATDGSNYRQAPIGVVLPRHRADVVAAMEIARHFGAPVTGRGCGTSLAGQCCNVSVVMDMSKYFNRVLGVDAAAKLGTVEPGCILDDLRDVAAEHGLTFGPDPATHDHCTLGGMIGNNSCGVHSVMAAFDGPGARTSDNVHELDVLTYDGTEMRVGPTRPDELAAIISQGGRRGEIYRAMRDLRDKYATLIRERFPKIPRRVSGYNLPDLLPENGFNVARALTGSEGTLVTVLEATLHLINAPKARSLLALGYDDVYAAGDHVPDLLAFRPIGLEGIDHKLIGYMTSRGLHSDDVTLLPPGRGWLLAEFGGDTKADADATARAAMTAIQQQPNAPRAKLFTDPAEAQRIWQVRESGLGATAFVPGKPDTWPGWEDSAVPPDRVGDYLRKLRDLFRRYDYDASLYGHFGQGCIHCRIPFDLTTAHGLAQYRAFVDEAADLVLSFGGSLSGEHGDGQARAELLPKMYGPELMTAFHEFKAIWDPEWKMNPGKVIQADPILANLRVGTGYQPQAVHTHFAYPDDQGSFARATLRCVGVGKCRRLDGDTMCPSFKVTREEQHTTRGRAHLLFEMLRGDVIGKHGWQDEAVKGALDLCLACKGCKSDCPVNVDMATYKAEFLAHYYQGRLRPRAAYAMGWIYWWARLGSHMPRLVNAITSNRALSAIAKTLGGIATARRVPTIATESFVSWFRRRSPAAYGGPPVILWPDTFNNYFRPAAARDAVTVLEAAGCSVRIPQRPLCCGRPLYDFGFLSLAKSQLEQILDTLRPDIRAGVPIIGLEPSCVTVFRDELTNLLPHDEDATRLSRQTFLLSEWLAAHAPDFAPGRLGRKAIVQMHCHHGAVMGVQAEASLLSAMALDWERPETGCCGMAGSFGFEHDKYDVSTACADRALVPAVRAAAADTLIIADGFSCREQIEQLTGRHARHISEVLRMSLDER